MVVTRVIVLSDTHGAFDVLRDLVHRYQKEAACFLHCGDGVEEIGELLRLEPEIPLYAVRGNCDFQGGFPASRTLDLAGHRIFLTHGHLYGVAYSDEPLKEAAREAGADIALFGHLHRGSTAYDNGLYLMNPGSPVRPRGCAPSFGILDLSEAGVFLNLVSYERKYR